MATKQVHGWALGPCALHGVALQSAAYIPMWWECCPHSHRVEFAGLLLSLVGPLRGRVHVAG